MCPGPGREPYGYGLVYLNIKSRFQGWVQGGTGFDLGSSLFDNGRTSHDPEW